MRTITDMGITLRTVTDMIIKVAPVTGTALGITRTCTIGIVSPFTDAPIGAAMATLIKNHCSVDLISEVLPFGRLWYGEPNAAGNAVSYAMHCSRSLDAVICVYDASGNVIETHEHKGDSKEPSALPHVKKKPPCGEPRRLIASVG